MCAESLLYGNSFRFCPVFHFSEQVAGFGVLASVAGSVDIPGRSRGWFRNKCENVFQTADFGPVLGTKSIYATNNCPISFLTIAGRWPDREAFESAIKKKRLRRRFSSVCTHKTCIFLSLRRLEIQKFS